MITRRQFGLGALAVGTLGFSSAFDYSARSTFDEFDRAFHASSPVGHNERGGLAWGHAYAMTALVRMYEAYKDTHYLDRLVTVIDLVLAQRDSERGAADHRGLSLPAWRALAPYTLGRVTLKDTAGQDLIELRTSLSYADNAVATVTAVDSPGKWKLEVKNTRHNLTTTYAYLSLDPLSNYYAIKQINDAYPTATTRVTARELRATPVGNTRPAAGAVSFVSDPVIFSVHTGMITYPMAAFARVVLTDPALSAIPKYHAKALEYLDAAKQAAAVHDHEWRQTADGYGYFVWNKGTPLPHDGVEQPTNQSLALGKTYCEIAAATGDPLYRDRAERMARTFRRELTGAAATWTYWPKFGHAHRGWSRAANLSEYSPSLTPQQQIEDLSHGAIDVEFAARAHRSGIHFTRADLTRFSRTYTDNLIAPTGADGHPTAYMRIDGTGSTTNAGQYLQAPRWLAGAAAADRRPFTHSRSIYDARRVQPQQGSFVLGVAYLNWYAVTQGV
ncbi:hypothetical protein [Nonomuraea longicatena]|uniref:Uncharacterized protein n=1 Tax=Nonomuraea longicatena TaxID=83682 RepID=A0ABN1PWI6_9ACTN